MELVKAICYYFAICTTILVGNSEGWDWSGCHVYSGWTALFSWDVARARDKTDCLFGCLLKDATCSVVSFNEETGLCYRHTFQTAIMVNGTPSTVTIGTPRLEAVYTMDSNSGSSYDYQRASQVCQELHGRLMTLSELSAFHSETGFTVDWCGWLMDGTMWRLGNGAEQCFNILADAWCKIFTLN